MRDWDITAEEIYYMETEYIFCEIADLPPATYLGNGEWLGTDGKHYIVED